MHNVIEADLRRLDAGAGRPPTPALVGHGRFNGDLPVSSLAGAAVSAAVSALQSLHDVNFGHLPDATVDRAKVDQWCRSSVIPLGWTLPSKWDPYANDYRTTDGWIRLHTNAEHHLAAARRVLGMPATPEAAGRAIARWDGEELETAIVEAGGCAARLRTREDWDAHPQGRAVSEEPIVIWDEADKHPSRWRPVNAKRPLSGLRVLDLTRVLAGPVATRFLASFGADVLRIDPPHWNEDGNAIEMTVGKTCAGLDLKDPDDREMFRRLVREADVLVHGLRADALHKMGFGTVACRELNPGLVTVGLNAYGWSGPWSTRRGFDSLVQRSAGLAFERAGAIIDLPYQVLDHATGYLTAAAVLHGLRLQRSGDRVLSARLSLARQAKLLIDHATAACAEAGREGGPTDAQGSIEHTDWGDIRRIGLPYRVEGIETGWRVAAHRLRSDPPAWHPAS
ncbi:CoA transferase [Paracoccus sp. TK19116]|uniref:CoA transferase n=1 Tax=Paracoccus albicereus TaxID=2922394 RepID=A0ABT1MYQ9_9RHOB|nr:CoA transferase [Paracoccus albicereus]MCQ0972001.1 CoA transferase [Paracoccus albicereus]